jgi:hypothetical protein
MALSSQEISDFRADLGDQTKPFAFTDDEIQRLFEREDSDYADTLLLAIKQLLMNATKFYNYVSGHTRQEQEKIFDHLKNMYDLQQASIISKQQVTIVGTATVPTAHKEKPKEHFALEGLPDARLQFLDRPK